MNDGVDALGMLDLSVIPLDILVAALIPPLIIAVVLVLERLERYLDLPERADRADADHSNVVGEAAAASSSDTHGAQTTASPIAGNDHAE